MKYLLGFLASFIVVTKHLDYRMARFGCGLFQEFLWVMCTSSTKTKTPELRAILLSKILDELTSLPLWQSRKLLIIVGEFDEYALFFRLIELRPSITRQNSWED